MRLERVLHHGQDPPLELRARRVQPVVHGRDRHPQERRDVLVGAVVHVVERDDFAEGSRQVADRGQHGTRLLAPLDPAIRRRLVGGHGVGRAQRQRFEMLASQHPVSSVPHDPTEPAGERGRVGQARQGVPGRDERFLDDVFGLAEVANERERVAEGHVLEAADDLGEGVEIASGCGPNRSFQVHRPSSPVGARIGPSALQRRCPANGVSGGREKVQLRGPNEAADGPFSAAC